MVFTYKGMDGAGKKVSGVVDAENIKAARAKLRKMNVFATDLVEGAKNNQKKSSLFNRIKVSDMSMMTSQLSTLISANVPLVDSLAALSEQIEHPKLKDALVDIRNRVTEGVKLSDAIKAHPKIFSDLYTNMIAAGEASGSLDLVLKRLSEFTEAQSRLQSKIKSAMTYPVIMLVLGSLVVLFLLSFVVPKITKIFEDNKVALPLPTEILISISHFLASYWWLVLIVLGLGSYGINRYRKTLKGQRFFDRLTLKMPIFGDLFRMVAVSRFCRTLATMLSSGVQLIPAMEIAKNIVQNIVLADVIEETKASVKEGESIAEPLKRSNQFPPLVTQMIAIGEKTGELETMMEKVAVSYDNQVDDKVSALTSLLEPVMIVGMGLVVGFIILSVMLPMLKMSQMAKG